VRADTYETLMLDAALLALAEQENAVRDLRARAGTLLAASALTVSFLGTQTLDRDGLSLVAWLAIMMFVLSLTASVGVLIPNSEMSFSLDPTELNDDPVRDERLPAAQLQIAQAVIDRRAANLQKFDRLAISYRMGARALLLQAGLWTAGLTPLL
jgi:hypothetical protein